MDPFITGALISGGANILGGMFSQSSARGAYQHRYQDTVKDMRRAGLNPALAYGQNPGGGAQTHDFGDVGSQATQGGMQAASAAQMKANTEMTRAQTDVYKATAENLKLRAGLENENLLSNTHLADQTAALRGWEGNKARADADVAERTRDTRVTNAKVLAELDRLRLPEARAIAKFFRDTGNANQYLNGAMQLLRLLRGGR